MTPDDDVKALREGWNRMMCEPMTSAEWAEVAHPDRIRRILDEREKLMAAAPLCEKHKPKGGTRAMCLVCAGEKLQSALSRISYLCGDPNDMECGAYDVHCDEDAVVAQVQSILARLEAAERDAAKPSRWCGDPVNGIGLKAEGKSE